MSRYSRNRLYLSYLEQDQLKNFAIIIAGSGIGSNIAECALRTGFEKLCVIDGDLIEESNLNRQNYTEQEIGTSKAAALYKRLKSINSNAEITFIDKYIDVKNMPDLRGYNAGINALDYKNEAPQLFDKLCKEKDIPVLHPYNVGWGGLVTVLSPNGPSLHSLAKNRDFSEVDAVEYAAGYKRYWNAPQVWLEEIIKLYKEETVNLPPPQLAVGSWFVAAMCTHLLVKIATGKPYKKYPQFYLSSLFEESSPETAELK